MGKEEVKVSKKRGNSFGAERGKPQMPGLDAVAEKAEGQNFNRREPKKHFNRRERMERKEMGLHRRKQRGRRLNRRLK
jgi:hypothetical protein